MNDPLRFDFITELCGYMESYSISLSEAARRGNAEACRAYFECLRATARDLNKTLQEVENGLEADARHTNERDRVKDGGSADALSGDKQQ